MSYHRDRDANTRAVGAIASTDKTSRLRARQQRAAAIHTAIRDRRFVAMTGPIRRIGLGKINTEEHGEHGTGSGGGSAGTYHAPTSVPRPTSRPGSHPYVPGAPVKVTVTSAGASFGAPSRSIVTTLAVPVAPPISTPSGTVVSGGGGGGGGSWNPLPVETIPITEGQPVDAPDAPSSSGWSTQKKLLVGAAVLAGLLYLRKKGGT